MDSKLFNYAKSPIPVLNNSSPHNYVIMSALLSHIDSPITPVAPSTPPLLSSYQFSSSYPNLLTPSNCNRSSNNTNQSLQSSFSKTTNRQYQTNHHFQNGVKLSNSNNNNQNRALSSKEIIYTAKRLKLQSLDTTQQNNNNNNLVLFNNENDNANTNLQEVDDDVNEEDATSNHYETIATTNVPIVETDFTTTHHQMNKFVMDSRDTFSSDMDTSSLINSTTLMDQNHVTNTTSNFIIETDSFVNDVNHQTEAQDSEHQTDYSNIFTESHSDNSNIINNHDYQEVNNVENYDQHIENSNNQLVTYTISCPSDWQFNLNRMINCFIILNKKNNQDINTDNVRLKCSVCKEEFKSINDLLKHKELDDSCKNNININSEDEIPKRNTRKTPRKVFNANSIDNAMNSYYADEDFEEELNENDIDDISPDKDDQEDDDDDEYFENLNEDMDNFYLDACEDETNEENDLEEFDTSLNDDSNENQNIYKNHNKKSDCPNDLIFYNNKLVSKIKLKNNVKFKLKNISSSSDCEREDLNLNEKTSNSKTNQTRNDKPVKARRKYNKSKANTVASLTCEKCNKTCRTKAELLVHLHKHAGNGAECWECGKKCASFSNLVSHVQLHTGEKPYTCQFCGKQFTQDAHLTRHIRLHTGERPFVCNICGKNYKDYSYYKTHLRIHKGERLYKCNYCNKEYYDASYYKKHTRLHTGEKPYMCTVCGRQFHRSDYLKLHSYSHTDERPFNCNICGKGFKMNYNLKIHLKNHENQEQINQATFANSSNDESSSFNESNNFANSAPTTTSTNNINSVNESFHSQNSLDNSTLAINLNDPKSHAITNIVNTNDFNTNEIVTLFIQDMELDMRNGQKNKIPIKIGSNSIGLDANTIQIINNSASNHHNHHAENGLGNLDVSLLDDHQISIVN